MEVKILRERRHSVYDIVLLIEEITLRCNEMCDLV